MWTLPSFNPVCRCQQSLGGMSFRCVAEPCVGVRDHFASAFAVAGERTLVLRHSHCLANLGWSLVQSSRRHGATLYPLNPLVKHVYDYC